MNVTESTPILDKMLGAELSSNRQAHNQRLVEDATRYNLLKSAIVSGDADMLNKLSESREKFDDTVDDYGKELVRSYYASRKHT